MEGSTARHKEQQAITLPATTTYQTAPTVGERVIVVGRDKEGGETYRTATVTTVRVVPSGNNDDSGNGTTLKVRFTGTAKGMADEVVDARDTIKRNEGSLRLKKEYEARLRREASCTLHIPPLPPSLAAAADTVWRTNESDQSFSSLPPPSLPLSRSPAALSRAPPATTKNIMAMLPTPSRAGPDSSPPLVVVGENYGKKRKSWDVKTSLLLGSAINKGIGDSWSVDPATAAASSDLTRRRGEGGPTTALPIGRKGRDIAGWAKVGMWQVQRAVPLPSRPSPSITAKEHRGGAGRGNGSSGGGDAVEARHSLYADMVVEAVRALRESRGSSLSGMATWIRNSHYGRLLASMDDSTKEFKATVVVGIKQALAQGKLVKNRTLYRVSPAHIQALARAEDTTKSSGELIDRRDSSHFVESEPAAAPVRTPEKLRLGDVHTKENPIIKNAAMAADDRGTRIEAIDGSGRRGGLGGGRSGGGILGRGSRSGGRERRGGRGSRGGGRGGRGGSAQGCIEDDGSRGEGLSPSAASRMRDASMFEARTTEAWQSPDFPGTAGASLVGGEVVKAEATAAAASAVVGSAAKLEQPQQGTPSSTPRQRIPKRSSSESAAISLERIEDEIVHAAKQREGKASVEGVPQQRPDRPAPLHRMQVPAGAVGDLLAVWDFLKTFGPEVHAEQASRLTLDEFENAVTAGGEDGVHPLIAGLNVTLLKAVLGRNEDGSSSLAAENDLSSMKPMRRVLGDLLNAATWPEVLRLFVSAQLRYSRALFLRHGQGEVPDRGHSVSTAVESLKRWGYGELSTTEILCLLRWLSDTLMDSAVIRGKVNDQVERLSRLTIMDRRKAEADKHMAFLAAESLNALVEASSNRQLKSQKELAVAEEAVRRGKQLEQQQEESSFSAVRRDALGWDRDHNRYWWFPGDPSAHIHVEAEGGAGWGQYTTIEEAVALRDSLHPRGRRGGPLRRKLCLGMEEMGTRFEAVREKEEARTKVREEAKRKERERVEKEAAKAAAALVTAAAASAAMEASEEPRRSGRKRPTPRSQEPTSVEETVKAARQKARAEAELRAARAREVDALHPYSPLLPAWKQRTLPPKKAEDILRHLKLELITMEEQLTRLRTSVGGRSTKAKKTWLREVANAEDALAIRQPTVHLEEAVYACTREMTADLVIDWTRMVVPEGEDVLWKSPYDWNFLQVQARERRRSRNRDQGGGDGDGAKVIEGVTEEHAGDSGPAANDSAGILGSEFEGDGSSAAPAKTSPRGKRKASKKTKRAGPRELARRAAAAAAAAATAAAAEAVTAKDAKNDTTVWKVGADGGRARETTEQETVAPEAADEIMHQDSATTRCMAMNDSPRADFAAITEEVNEQRGLDESAVISASVGKLSDIVKVRSPIPMRASLSGGDENNSRGDNISKINKQIDDGSGAADNRGNGQEQGKGEGEESQTLEEDRTAGAPSARDRTAEEVSTDQKQQVAEQEESRAKAPCLAPEQPNDSGSPLLLLSCAEVGVAVLSAGPAEDKAGPAKGIEGAKRCSGVAAGHPCEDTVSPHTGVVPDDKPVCQGRTALVREAGDQPVAADETVEMAEATVEEGATDRAFATALGGKQSPGNTAAKVESEEIFSANEGNHANAHSLEPCPADGSGDVGTRSVGRGQNVEGKTEQKLKMREVLFSSSAVAKTVTAAEKTEGSEYKQPSPPSPEGRTERTTAVATTSTPNSDSTSPTGCSVPAESDTKAKHTVTDEDNDDNHNTITSSSIGDPVELVQGKQQQTKGQDEEAEAAADKSKSEAEELVAEKIYITKEQRGGRGGALADAIEVGKETERDGDCGGDGGGEGGVNGEQQTTTAVDDSAMALMAATASANKNSDGSSNSGDKEDGGATRMEKFKASPSPPEAAGEALATPAAPEINVPGATATRTAPGDKVDIEDDVNEAAAVAAAIAAVAAAAAVAIASAASASSVSSRFKSGTAEAIVKVQTDQEAVNVDAKAEVKQEQDVKSACVAPAKKEGKGKQEEERDMEGRGKSAERNTAETMGGAGSKMEDGDEDDETALDTKTTAVSVTTLATQLMPPPKDLERCNLLDQAEAFALEDFMDDVEEEEEEEDVEPEKRWEMERENIAMANMSAKLLGALSSDPAHREAWRAEILAAQTLAGVATMIHAFVTTAATVLPLLQEQETQEQALIQQNLAVNQAFHVRCSSTFEIVWARLHGFPWWPALVVKPEGVGFLRSLEESGDRLVVFMNENEQFRVNHRFCKPFIGTSQDDVMRRVSRSNKRMAKAIKMGLKGLRIAYETLGPTRDPNSPVNRPRFYEPESVSVESPAPEDVTTALSKGRVAPHPGAQRELKHGRAGGAEEGCGSGEEVWVKTAAADATTADAATAVAVAGRKRRCEGEGSHDTPARNHKRKLSAGIAGPTAERQSSRKKKLSAVAQEAVASGLMTLPFMREAAGNMAGNSSGRGRGGGNSDGQEDGHFPPPTRLSSHTKSRWTPASRSDSLSAYTWPRPAGQHLSSSNSSNNNINNAADVGCGPSSFSSKRKPDGGPGQDSGGAYGGGRTKKQPIRRNNGMVGVGGDLSSRHYRETSTAAKEGPFADVNAPLDIMHATVTTPIRYPHQQQQRSNSAAFHTPGESPFAVGGSVTSNVTDSDASGGERRRPRQQQSPPGVGTGNYGSLESNEWSFGVQGQQKRSRRQATGSAPQQQQQRRGSAKQGRQSAAAATAAAVSARRRSTGGHRRSPRKAEFSAANDSQAVGGGWAAVAAVAARDVLSTRRCSIRSEQTFGGVSSTMDQGAAGVATAPATVERQASWINTPVAGVGGGGIDGGLGDGIDFFGDAGVARASSLSSPGSPRSGSVDHRLFPPSTSRGENGGLHRHGQREWPRSQGLQLVQHRTQQQQRQLQLPRQQPLDELLSMDTGTGGQEGVGPDESVAVPSMSSLLGIETGDGGDSDGGDLVGQQQSHMLQLQKTPHAYTQQLRKQQLKRQQQQQQHFHWQMRQQQQPQGQRRQECSHQIPLATRQLQQHNSPVLETTNIVGNKNKTNVGNAVRGSPRGGRGGGGAAPMPIAPTIVPGAGPLSPLLSPSTIGLPTDVFKSVGRTHLPFPRGAVAALRQVNLGGQDGGEYGVVDNTIGADIALPSTRPVAASMMNPLHQHRYPVLTPATAAPGGAVEVIPPPVVGLEGGLSTMSLPALGLDLPESGRQGGIGAGARQHPTLSAKFGLSHENDYCSSSHQQSSLSPIVSSEVGRQFGRGGMVEGMPALELELGQQQQQQLGGFGQQQADGSATDGDYVSSGLMGTQRGLVGQARGGLTDLGLELGLGMPSDLDQIANGFSFDQDLSIGQVHRPQQQSYDQPHRRPQQQLFDQPHRRPQQQQLHQQLHQFQAELPQTWSPDSAMLTSNSGGFGSRTERAAYGRDARGNC